MPVSGEARHDRAWAEHLAHPLPLAAVGLLLLNDHLLKGSGLAPGWLTGKLSDFAGLFFFPVLLAALARVARRRWRAGPPPELGGLALAAVAATGATFAATKLHPGFNGWAAPVLGRNVLDPTDLLALAALVPAWWWLRRARPLPAWQRLQVPAVVLAGLASVATQSRHEVLRAPQGAERVVLGCAELRQPEVVLLGSSASVELVLARSPGACAVEMLRASLRTRHRLGPLDDIERTRGAEGTERVTLGGWEAAPLRDGVPIEREATLVVELRVEGRDERWEISLVPVRLGSKPAP